MSHDWPLSLSNPPGDLEHRWQYRILLGIDHQQNGRLLATLLEQFYSLQPPPEASLQWGQIYDLCIFDSLFFGRHTQEIAEQRAAASPIFLPFLLLAKRAHLPLLTITQRQQVDDVITIPVDQTELLMRVESLLRTRQQSLKLSAMLVQEQLLEQQLQADNQILQKIATQDGLTGIANRRAFDDKLAYEWKLGRRERSSLVLVLCDVDYFKAYNDTYGHVLGDQCLRAIAGVLKMVMRRPADIAARYGGEEFALILPNTDTEGALHIVNHLRGTLQARAIPHQASPMGGTISLSFGLAEVIPTDPFDVSDLVRAADAALYRAKTEGRDRVIVAPPLDHQA